MAAITRGTAEWVQLCARAQRPVRERRSAVRAAARSPRACLRWERAEQALIVGARLRDVSLSGLAAVIETAAAGAPAVGQRVGVCLGSRPAEPWVLGVVVGRAVEGGDEAPKTLVRLRFGKGCPYPFFHMVSDGLRRRSAGEPGRGLRRWPCLELPR